MFNYRKMVVNLIAISLSLFVVTGFAFKNPEGKKAKVAPEALQSAEQRAFVYVTLYGSPDNDPPGSGEIAYPVIHEQAGGTGTFEDPVTMAVKRRYLPVGQKIYYPSLHKYFIVEDLCASCSRNHVDLWAGYGTRRGGILRCEENLTRGSAEIIINPVSTYPVDVTPIWNESTRQCQTPYN